MGNIASTNGALSVGRRLAEARQTAGLSQKEFAIKLGVPLRSYQHYERGEREVSAVLIKALYTVFRIDPIWLLIDGDEAFEATTGQGDIMKIDKNLFLSVLKEIQNFALTKRREHLDAELLGKLAMIVHGRVAGIETEHQYEATLREIAQAFEILESGPRPSEEVTSPGSKLKRLLTEWMRLEVASQLIFIRVVALSDPTTGKYIAKDLGNKKQIAARAQWRLRLQLLTEGIIGRDSHSIEHLTPLDHERCVSWLESQCADMKTYLNQAKSDLAEGKVGTTPSLKRGLAERKTGRIEPGRKTAA